MSFQFNWSDFDPVFYAETKQQLEIALNKEKKSKHIADYIFVKELGMGFKPPELEILEICELSTDYFRGIFKLTYCGDACIDLKTKVQVNPLHNSPPLYDENNYYRPLLPQHSRPTMLTATQPLVVPMLLRISDIQLDGTILLSFSKSKGITLLFKNDPLTHLQVSSTVDIIPSIKSYLQQQIESRLRAFLLDTLPLVVHEYSLHQINDDHHQQQQTRPSEYHSASLFTQFLQRRQQNYNGNNNDNIFGGTTFSNTTTNSIPDLMWSSSDSFSDTSSECMSYADVDNNSLALIPSPLATELYQFKNADSNTKIHCNDYSFTASPSLSRTGSLLLQKQPSCVYQSNQNGDNTNTNDHYIDDATPSTSSVLFDQPIFITTDDSHGLIKRMGDISTSSQTLAIDMVSSSAFSIHSTVTGNVHQRRKIPKRRIIKWNA